MPSDDEYNDTILPKAEEYTLEYLRNPDLWEDSFSIGVGEWIAGKYHKKKMFYDDETRFHMAGRSERHLIDTFHAKFWIDADGNMNTKVWRIS